MSTVTPSLMYAISLLADMCGPKESRKGVECVKEMLAKFDDEQFSRFSAEEATDWIANFLPKPEKPADRRGAIVDSFGRIGVTGRLTREEANILRDSNDASAVLLLKLIREGYFRLDGEATFSKAHNDFGAEIQFGDNTAILTLK